MKRNTKLARSVKFLGIMVTLLLFSQFFTSLPPVIAGEIITAEGNLSSATFDSLFENSFRNQNRDITYPGPDTIFKDGQIDVRYFSQFDDRWGGEAIASNGTLEKNGCGIAVTTMIVYALSDYYRNANITPVDVKNFMLQTPGALYLGTGKNTAATHWTGIQIAAKAYGFDADVYGKYAMTEEMLRTSLSYGGLVCLLVGGSGGNGTTQAPNTGVKIGYATGDYANGGHYVLVRGINEEGRFLIADPASSSNCNNSYSWAELTDNAKGGTTVSWTVVNGSDEGKIWTESNSYYPFDLPVVGSTGFTAIQTEFITQNGDEAFLLPSGTKFKIIEDNDPYWGIMLEDGTEGTLSTNQCMINLPDVLPSMVYYNTNAISSCFTAKDAYSSSIVPIEHITGEVLYDSLGYNPRLDREEYVMPVLFNTAKKIALAQMEARSHGHTLVLAEAYRSMEVQSKISGWFSDLAFKNEGVMASFSERGFSSIWFADSTNSPSSHQHGIAVDVLIAEVLEIQEKAVHGFTYEEIIEYQILEGNTAFHHLSPDSSSVSQYNLSLYPYRSNWDWASSEEMGPGINDSTYVLNRYMRNAGFSPLVSEWWHFDDWDSLQLLTGRLQYHPSAGLLNMTEMSDILSDAPPLDYSIPPEYEVEYIPPLLEF